MCFQIESILVWNLSLLTIFQKLSAASNTVFYVFIKILVLMKITYFRDKQLIWLEGNFEKATFSR